MINNHLPDRLNPVDEPLGDSCDEDRVDVPLLQLAKQHVHVWHELVKQCQEKAEIPIFDGLETPEEVILVLKYSVNSTTVEVPLCDRSSRKSVVHHLIKYGSLLE